MILQRHCILSWLPSAWSYPSAYRWENQALDSKAINGKDGDRISYSVVGVLEMAVE